MQKAIRQSFGVMLALVVIDCESATAQAVARVPGDRTELTAGSRQGVRSAVKPRATQDQALRLIVGGVAMQFVRIQPGEFVMGSVAGDEDEKPPHRVRITKLFEMGKYEVTQAQWEAVMGANPSSFRGSQRPVEQVSWHDVQEFLQKLNARKDGFRYRLPTEAEWEYAARAGTTEDVVGNLGSVAWYEGNAYGETRLVGHKQANAWGLHDMLGNVWEWCNDWYDETYYRNSPMQDPQGPSSGQSRVVRGGSWSNGERFVRFADRDWTSPGDRYVNGGFRCVREVSP